MLKMESVNPGGSIKDRPANHIINHAEASGLLQPNGTIIESSSGNFGISLAMLGAKRGYRVIILVDPKSTRTNVAMLRARGAEVMVVTEKDAGGGYHRSRIRTANELAKSTPGAFRPDQCSNPLNAMAHYESTAREILEQTRGQLDYVVVATSTGGQISGIARHFAENAPHIRVVAADVRGSAIFGGPYRPYYTQGVGMAWTPISINQREIHAAHLVHDEDSFSTTRILAHREGICAGASTGTVLFVMCHYAQRYPGARILGVMADSGDRYLDTVYSDLWLEERGLRTNIGYDEFLTRSRRRGAPIPAEEVAYVEPDLDLIPPEWHRESMRLRGSDQPIRSSSS